MTGLALVAECSRRVGSGHAVETSHLAASLGSVRHRVFLTRAAPAALRRRFRSPVELVPDLSVRSLAHVARRSRALGLTAAAVNALAVTPAMIGALKKGGLKVAGLSVRGRKVRGADLWLTLGVENMIMAPAYARLARRPRAHRGPVRRLLVLMGGTDSSGSTAHLVRALAGRLPRVRKTLVVGPNFARPAELARALREARDPSFAVVHDPPDLPARMRRADAAITLGSDASLELACVGTPTILMEEAPHERRQARRLARGGAGLFAGSRREASPARLLAALRRLDDPSLRARMSRAGRRLVDGRGAERLSTALRELAA